MIGPKGRVSTPRQVHRDGHALAAAALEGTGAAAALTREDLLALLA